MLTTGLANVFTVVANAATSPDTTSSASTKKEKEATAAPTAEAEVATPKVAISAPEAPTAKAKKLATKSTSAAASQEAASSDMLSFGQTAQMTAKERLGEIFFKPAADDPSLFKEREEKGVYGAPKVALEGSEESKNKIDPATLSTDVKINWPSYTYEVGGTKPGVASQLGENAAVELTLPLAWVWRCTNSFAQTKPSIGKDESYTGGTEIAWGDVKIDKVASFFTVSGTVSKIDKENSDYICKVDFGLTKEIQDNIKETSKILHTDDRVAYAKSKLEAISKEHFVRAIAIKGNPQQDGQEAAAAGFVTGGETDTSTTSSSIGGTTIVVAGTITVTGISGEDLVSDDRRLGGEDSNNNINQDAITGADEGTIGTSTTGNDDSDSASSAATNEADAPATTAAATETTTETTTSAEGDSGGFFAMMMVTVTTLLMSLLAIIIKLFRR